MDESLVLLSRFQFALTICFHYIFPVISIGLAWMLVCFELKAYRSGDKDYEDLAKLFAKILGITFAGGVATGITMEFQFGTNWANYSKFVGDVFGAPLAAEAVLAFFLESTFIGFYLFGRARLPRKFHLFSGFMVAFGATLSAFWIVVANSWQQTPAGHVIANGRAELVDFWAAVFNPSTLPRFFHTVGGTIIMGAFLVAAVASYYLLKDRYVEKAKKALKVAIVFGLTFSVLEAMPFGHLHAVQVAKTQPVKLAAMEGHFEGSKNAAFNVFGFPDEKEGKLKFGIAVPGVLSLLVGNSLDTYVPGLNDYDRSLWPPVLLTFASFHSMVALGSLFIAIFSIAAFLWWRKKLFNYRLLYQVFLVALPLPMLANQLGWTAAEVGRQPWIVYNILKTSDATSAHLSGGQIWFSIIFFSIVYAFLGWVYLYLLNRTVKKGMEA